MTNTLRTKPEHKVWAWHDWFPSEAPEPSAEPERSPEEFMNAMEQAWGKLAHSGK